MAILLMLSSVPTVAVQTLTWFVVVVYTVCIIGILLEFERIDIIRRLEREVAELQVESNRIMERRERMMKFWGDMQNLTDLWLHRTVPRLDLLKEVQSNLDVTSPEDKLPLLAGINSRLEALEKALPELSYWRNDSEFSQAKKKLFAEKILNLCHEESLIKIIHSLNRVIEDGLPRPSMVIPAEAAE
eukprot:CAMPEP_0179030838 /NCGR_PEP_ID=MMETSP0796-20121207/10767_1 /TAXON_ID=73915 /ORGANISM="Pyrodinium bahamense, Strain pbaha01" /LENGTH=186 /DNA_ID=CAMNT_0020727023 /DNA_START=58 /DNA_END=618 /DNA_ORIENTATION=+